MKLQKLYSYTRQAINDFQLIQDGDKIAKINNIVSFRNTMDIKNGEQYLYEIPRRESQSS